MSTRYLAENKEYKLYSLFENVYLKDKSACRSLTEYEQSDRFVASMYGDPDSALITSDGVFVIIVGCGIIIHNIERSETNELFNEPEAIEWMEGVYQSAQDDCLHVRFSSITATDKLILKRLSLKSHAVEVLS